MMLPIFISSLVLHAAKFSDIVLKKWYLLRSFSTLFSLSGVTVFVWDASCGCFCFAAGPIWSICCCRIDMRLVGHVWPITVVDYSLAKQNCSTNCCWSCNFRLTRCYLTTHCHYCCELLSGVVIEWLIYYHNLIKMREIWILIKNKLFLLFLFNFLCQEKPNMIRIEQ